MPSLALSQPASVNPVGSSERTFTASSESAGYLGGGKMRLVNGSVKVASGRRIRRELRLARECHRKRRAKCWSVGRASAVTRARPTERGLLSASAPSGNLIFKVKLGVICFPH